MVRYREIPPSARLRSFVETFWILEHDGSDQAPQRVVPDGRSELILNWRDPFEAFQAGRWQRQPRCFFAGQIDGPLLLRASGPAKIMGIRFHPHGAASVFGRCMQELSGRFTAIADIAPNLSRELHRALEAADPVAAAEAVLLPREDDFQVAAAVRRIMAAKGAVDLAALASRLGLSTRQLERRFHATVGLPPKLLCRIARFNGVFRVLGDESGSWVQTAVDCGYYDQAHLIRDCKSFSGTTPAVLLAQDADLARHFYVSQSYNTAAGAAG